jgi:hypothetical protein
MISLGKDPTFMKQISKTNAEVREHINHMMPGDPTPQDSECENEVGDHSPIAMLVNREKRAIKFRKREAISKYQESPSNKRRVQVAVFRDRVQAIEG